MSREASHCLFASIAMIVTMMSIPQRPVSAQVIGERSPLATGAVEEADRLADQPGFRVAGLQLLPSAALCFGYDTNVLATPAPRLQDAMAIAEAGFRIANDPGWRNVEAVGFVRSRRFAEASDQNTSEYGLSAGFDLPWNSHNALAARVLSQRLFESRVDIETPVGRDVSFYTERQAELRYSHTFNHLKVASKLNGSQFAYAESSQDYRDISQYRGELELSYGLRGGLAVSATGYYGRDDYRLETPLVASAATRGALLGMQLLVTDLLTAEIGAGYFRRTYAQNLGDASGIAMRVSMLWKPTSLTSLQLRIAREDAPTRISGAFGKLRTDVSAELDQSYSRNTDFFLRAQVLFDDFQVIAQHDRTYVSSVGLKHRVSRLFSVAAEYDFAARTSEVPERSFRRHVFSLSIRGDL